MIEINERFISITFLPTEEKQPRSRKLSLRTKQKSKKTGDSPKTGTNSADRLVEMSE